MSEWPRPPHEVSCPRCHEQCGWCSDYRHMHGVLRLPGTSRRCGIRGLEPEGADCPLCHGKMRVIATTTYDELDPDRKRNGSDGNAASFRAITETRNLRNYEGESAPTRKDKQRGHSRRHAGFNDRWDQMTKAEQQENGRNLRNYEPAPLEVWPIATSPFPGAHFATFPQALVERALKAGCPIGGLVLDPFGGAGTVGLVAGRNQRNAVLVELNEDYAQMARERIDAGVGLFNHIDFEPPPKRDAHPVADQRLAERVRRGHQ